MSKSILDDEGIKFIADLGIITPRQALKDIRYFLVIAKRVKEMHPSKKFGIEKMGDEENTYRVLFADNARDHIEYYPLNGEVVRRSKNKYSEKP